MDLTVAFVRGAHGLTGEFKIESASGRYEHLLKLKEVTVRQDNRDSVYKVESVSGNGNAFYMKLGGIDTPEAAKKLNGAELRTCRENAVQLKKNEWYVEDLKGCSLLYFGNKDGLADEVAPVKVGSITDVLEGGAGDLLEVVLSESCGLLAENVRKTGNGKARTVLVPFNAEHVGKVDIQNRSVQLMHLWILE